MSLPLLPLLLLLLLLLALSLVELGESDADERSGGVVMYFVISGDRLCHSEMTDR